jgi:hypothetical protein
VRLVHEHDLGARDLTQPAVVLVPQPRAAAGAGDAVDQLGLDRRDLDVAGLRHPHELGADPDRVADVLERGDAEREVELVVAERPRLAVADVALHPALSVEALGAGAEPARDQGAPRLVRHVVEDHVGAVEGRRPAADVEDTIVVVQHGQDPLGALRKHGR